MSDDQWLEAYRSEFVRFACDRPGWLHLDAAAWARDLARGARSAPGGCDLSPEEAAQFDVLALEKGDASCTNGTTRS